MKRSVVICEILFAASVLLALKSQSEAPKDMFICALCLVNIIYAARAIRTKDRGAISFIASLVFAVLIAWELATNYLGIANPVLVPSPEEVFAVFRSARALMVKGIFSSLSLLSFSLATGLAFGVVCGLTAGWTPILRDTFYPIAKVMSPIPPIIYSPYIVALMPTFRSAAAMIIVLGVFWPTAMNMINRVSAMDRRIINSARALGVKGPAMIFKILLPYLLPGIISGLHVTLSTSFLLLTMAEMTGAASGLGYFIKNYSDYANYPNVIAGIILIGVVVTLLNVIITIAENRFARWRG